MILALMEGKASLGGIYPLVLEVALLIIDE